MIKSNCLFLDSVGVVGLFHFLSHPGGMSQLIHLEGLPSNGRCPVCKFPACYRVRSVSGRNATMLPLNLLQDTHNLTSSTADSPAREDLPATVLPLA
jgi:hypothetical protein